MKITRQQLIELVKRSAREPTLSEDVATSRRNLQLAQQIIGQVGVLRKRVVGDKRAIEALEKLSKIGKELQLMSRSSQGSSAADVKPE